MHDDTRQTTAIDAAIDAVAHAMTRGEPGARFRRGIADRIRSPRPPIVTRPRLALVAAIVMLVGLWTIQQMEQVQPVQPVQQVQQPQPRERKPVPYAVVQKGQAVQAVRGVRPRRITTDVQIAMDATNSLSDVPEIEQVVVAPVVIDAIEIGEDAGPPILTVQEIVVELLNVEPLTEPSR
jgi:hypothetical protein